MRRLISVTAMAVVLTLGSANALWAAGTQVSRQRAENEKWYEQAQKSQSSYMKLARKYERDDKDSKAASYYRKAMGVSYYKWNVRKKTYNRVREDENPDGDHNYLAGKRRQRVRLKGRIYDQAESALESLLKGKAQESLDDIYKQAREATRKKKYAVAYALCKKLKAAAQRERRTDASRYIGRAESGCESIEKRAASALKRIERDLKSRNPEKAVERFREYEKQFGDLEGGKELREQYERLCKDPKLIKIKGKKDSDEVLAQAEAYLKAKEYGFAYHEFVMAAEEFPETDAGKKARGSLDAMAKQGDIIVKAHELPRSRYARELVRRADAKLEANDVLGARRLYAYVIKRYPDCAPVCRLAQSHLKRTQ